MLIGVLIFIYSLATFMVSVETGVVNWFRFCNQSSVDPNRPIVFLFLLG